ncbi:hypothetical protein ACTU6V_06290 [Microbacterium sp. A204]|uniref:hypothetical protein n=1 Tax=Microbacterium sp. A204 TaxID=3457321 RepID=UPI003FD18B04
MLATGALALTALAFAHVRSAPEDGIVAPIPTLTQPSDQTASPSPTPAETTTPAYDRSQERFLAAASDIIWRGVAGQCGSVEPLLERSSDGGVTWTDVTPRYLGIGQLITLLPFADGQAEIVAAMGDNCDVQALRTFTQGQFWESYPEVLAASQYVDPADPASIVRPTGVMAAPCADARSLRNAGAVLALVCEDVAYVLGEDAEWVALAATAATALAVDATDVVVAHRSDGCTGVALTRYTDANPQAAQDAGCFADAAAPLALAASTAGITLWWGENVVTQ